MKKKKVEIPMEIRRLWSPDSEIEKEFKALKEIRKRPNKIKRIKKRGLNDRS